MLKKFINLRLVLTTYILLFVILSTNSYAINCANPGKDGPGGTLSGVINTYFTPSSTGTISSGATSVTLGSGSGSSTAISSGDLILFIQMQDASINSSNTTNYGSNASTSRGYTSLGSAGLYEYVIATNSVSISGGTLTFLGSGSGNGLVNSYNNQSESGTKGKSTYQIIRVPQYSSASLSSSLTASPWNGTIGGVLAFDVSGNLNLNSAIVNLNGMGFRGGGARQLGGGTGGSNSDLRNLSSNNFHASKGEGIAGTPRYVYNGTSIVDTGSEGYPNGSFAMGSPGNAGGGGTDGAPGSNTENSGGGGGSNRGQGGRGGNTWNSNISSGGFGGIALPTGIDRIYLGGGGGAGSRNDSTGLQSSGGVGGGLVMIRTISTSGSATINVNGTDGIEPDNDGGGGGGAGGSVLFFSQAGSITGLSINANGGKGGNAWILQPATSFPGERHGPGGGGGGGYVALSGSASTNVLAGANGLTTTANDAYGSVSGSSGQTVTSLTSTQIPGVNTLSSCFPNLTVTKSTSTSNVTYTGSGTIASYTINVSNATDKGTATNVIISDTLPTGFTYSSVGTITLSGGSTRTSVSNPTLGSSTPNFGVFNLPQGSSLSIPFNVAVSSSITTGTYQNPATATYDSPSRATTETLSSSYISSSSTNEDVNITAYDFGDAPDTYGTLDASTGAKHLNTNSNLIFLGTNSTDIEANGVPGTNSDGDDLAGTDDEDSVATFPTLTRNSTSYSLSVRVTNNTGSSANLRGWIDFNRDNVFQSTESVATTVATGTTGGTATLNWTGLTGLVAGQSYVRLRFTTDALLNNEPTGSKSNGEVEDYPLTIQGFDFGDAPDTYGTLDASTGAKHLSSGSANIFLGTNSTDVEVNGVPSTNADGDDLAGTDDEDSVSSFPSINTSSTSYSLSVRVTNNTGSPANLRGWIDFNRDNVFQSTESATTASPIPTGTTGGTATLNWTGLTGLVAGQSYVRLRFTTDALANNEPTGSKSNGEVEDYPLTILGADYGDAPNSYGTLDASTGAKHLSSGSTNIFLGTNATDFEANGIPSTNADGDDLAGTDDEDSVATFPILATTNTTYSLNVRVTNNTGTTANLRGWIDFNRDNAFQSTESVATTVATGTTGGTATLNWTGLTGLVAGQSYIRLRFTTDALANNEPTGSKSNGEVEDYPISIGNNSISGTVFRDINRNGILDGSELGIAGVPVTLVNSSNVCTTVNTNASGQYTFTGLINGTYRVIENGENSASCPPLARPVINMGGTTLLSKTLVVNDSSFTNQDFGNIQLSSLVPFTETCPVDGFISEKLNNTQLNSVDLYTNQKTTIGNAANFEYNGIGFNTVERFIYGIGIASPELIKIDSNGIALSLGEVSGLPSTAGILYGSGDYNPFNDRFYTQANNTTTIYSINLSTRTVDVTKNIVLPGTFSLVDLVFSPVSDPNDGINYIFATPQAPATTIYKINPSTGAVTIIPVAGLPNDVYIAGFADPDNNIYVENTQTNLYKITLNSNQTSAIVTEIINNNTSLTRADGARCPFSRVGSQFTFDPNNSGNGNPGDILYYSHEIFSKISGNIDLTLLSNQGFTYTLFKDDNNNSLLDSGDTPIVNGSLGNVYNELNHRMKIIVKVFIPNNVPQNTVDTAKITAVLTPTNTLIQPTSLFVTDVTTVSTNSNLLRLIKTVDKTTAKPNDEITYTITYTNSGGAPLNNIEIKDSVPANTTFVSATAIGTCSTNGVYNASTKLITWTISGTLSQGASGCVNFKVKVNN